MEAYDRIKSEIEQSSAGPFVLETFDLAGKVLPIRIKSSDGDIIVDSMPFDPDREHEFIVNANLLTHSKINAEILLKAVLKATGNDEKTARFLINHAQKEVLQEHGLLPTEVVAKRKD